MSMIGQSSSPSVGQSHFARKALISVIDETERHRSDITRALMSFYAIESFDDGSKALDQFQAEPPAVIVLDNNAGSKGGLEVLREIRSCVPLKEIPIIFTSSELDESLFCEVKKMGVNTCLAKPFKRSSLIKAISGLVNHGVENAWRDIEPVQRSALKKTISTFNSFADMIDKGESPPFKDVKDSCRPLVEAVQNNCYKDILKGIRGHDNYTYVHSMRVATLLSLFGHTIGIRGDDLLTLSTGGLVHDVGKMSIPHGILNKPTKLEGEEWTVMKGHVNKTIDFLQKSQEVPGGAMIIAWQHHEKLDGSGYPKGLKKSELNELARMAAIVDMFGALTDRRIYKEPMLPEDALYIMLEKKNEIDQHLLAMFRDMLLSASLDMDD